MTSLHFFKIFLFLIVDPGFGSFFVSSTELVLEFKVDGEELEEHDMGETGFKEDGVTLKPISVSRWKIFPFNTSISFSRTSMRVFLSASSALSSVTSLKRLTLLLAFPARIANILWLLVQWQSVCQSSDCHESGQFNQSIRGITFWCRSPAHRPNEEITETMEGCLALLVE